MQKCLKYLNSVNLMFLTDLLMGNVFASGAGDGSDGVTDDDHGFGTLYKWRTLVDGFAEAKKTRKPMMIIVHKPWCPACQQLKPKFAKSIKLLDISRQFVMVNFDNSRNELKDAKFQPDGKYVPRILFFTPDGELIKEVYNRHPVNNPEFKYFYGNSAQILESMVDVLNMYPGSPLSGKREKNAGYVNYNTQSDTDEDDISTETIRNPSLE